MTPVQALGRGQYIYSENVLNLAILFSLSQYLLEKLNAIMTMKVSTKMHGPWNYEKLA